MPRMTAGAAHEHKATASEASADAGAGSVTNAMSFQDRMLAESIARLESAEPHRGSDRDANERARREGGTFEQRIVTRAAAHREAEPTRDAVAFVNRTLGWLTLLLIVLGCALGFATVRTTLAADDEGRVNLFLALGGMLGIQTLLLLIWLGAIIVVARPGRRGLAVPQFSLGSFVLAAAMWLVRKVQSSEHAGAAARAVGRVYARSAIGRWALSSMTHGFWAAFNVGTLLALIVLLSARHYVFVWETTILNEQQYVRLTQTIGALPAAAGFIVPTEEQITASRWTGEPLSAHGEAAREAWSSLLVGAVVLYGFGPRVLLLGLSLSMLRRGRKRYRLDLTEPEHARLKPVLMTMHARSERKRTGTDLSEDRSSAVGQAPERDAGAPAIVGIELDRDADQRWSAVLKQPTLPDDRRPINLGIIETGAQQQTLVDHLRRDETEPRPLVIVCSLTTTPDRGLEHTLREITASVHHSPKLILTGGQAVRKRATESPEVEQRIADWHALVQRIGVPDDCVFELDLDSLTDESAKRLREVVFNGATDLAERTGQDDRRSHVQQSFERIAEHAAEWLHQSPPHPTTEQQVELHRAITTQYTSRSGALKQFYHESIDTMRKNPEQAIRDAAGRMRMVLPDRLRGSAQWAAAGAAAGAFGCIAASLAFTPMALAALPAWSMLGGVVAGLWRAAAAEAQPDAPPPERADEKFHLAVRAAALDAVVLELQGNDESTITRILDRTFGPEEPSSLSTSDDVKAWLASIRERVDAAQQSEGVR